jgi:ABC-type Na+ efflux pump permease subunit
LAHPVRGWELIRGEYDRKHRGWRHVLVMALIPVVCGYIGTTQVGWRIGPGEPIRITGQSGLLIAVLYYLAIIVGVYSVAYMIHWMASTYGAHQRFGRSLVLASFIPLPLFLAGLMQLYPVLWLNLLVGLPAVAYTVALLYTGIPVMMDIPKERGFLFASAVLAAGLVLLVGMLATTVVLWSIGFEPAFTTKLD